MTKQPAISEAMVGVARKSVAVGALARTTNGEIAAIYTAMRANDDVVRGLVEALTNLRGLFAHALETPGYGDDAASQEELRAHFDETDAALAAAQAAGVIHDHR